MASFVPIIKNISEFPEEPLAKTLRQKNFGIKKKRDRSFVYNVLNPHKQCIEEIGLMKKLSQIWQNIQLCLFPFWHEFMVDPLTESKR